MRCGGWGARRPLWLEASGQEGEKKGELYGVGCRPCNHRKGFRSHSVVAGRLWQKSDMICIVLRVPLAAWLRKAWQQVGGEWPGKGLRWANPIGKLPVSQVREDGGLGLGGNSAGDEK